MSTIFWNRNIVNEAHHEMKDFAAAGQNILWFAFAPPGGNHWSVVTDNTFFNRNIPDECHQKMKDLVAAGQKIVCVAFRRRAAILGASSPTRPSSTATFPTSATRR